jgi:hypothetical protein
MDDSTDPRRSLLHEIDRPIPSDIDPGRRRLLLTRQIVVFAGAMATLIEIVVWLSIALLGGGLDAPWWLWTAVPALAAVGVLTALDRFRAANDQA